MASALVQPGRIPPCESPISDPSFNGSHAVSLVREVRPRRRRTSPSRPRGRHPAAARGRGAEHRAARRAAGVDPSYLRRIEDRLDHRTRTCRGDTRVLGADVPAARHGTGCGPRTRLYPNTGPPSGIGTRARWPRSCSRRGTPGGRRTPRSASGPGPRLDRSPSTIGRPGSSSPRSWSPASTASSSSSAGLPKGGVTRELGWLGIARGAPDVSRLLIVRRTRASPRDRGSVRAAAAARLPRPSHGRGRGAAPGSPAWPGSAMVWVVLDGARSHLVTER